MTVFRTTRIALLISISALAATGVFAENFGCERIYTVPSEDRIYQAPNSWVIYEGSLQQNLLDISKRLGIDRVIVDDEIDFDVFLRQRLISHGPDAIDVASIINSNIRGVRVNVDTNNNAFRVKRDMDENFHKETLAARECDRVIKFEVTLDSFESNYKRFADYSGWKVDFTGIPPLDRKLRMTPRIITGSTYFDLATQLLTDINMEAQIEP
ncbi:hypothetical protein [Marinomonas sp. 2405UD68-3]|uniref:hypothetical protein n=1 Tax=Marinomonas sp. 2405UD68-3 TaxID=3391835 RepID=UPI0039C91148